MVHETVVDTKTGRKFLLDFPGDLKSDDKLTFILSLHGGGSVGQWQRAYFPAYEHADLHRLVVATPSAATKTPFRMWIADADDEHLKNIVELIFERFGGKSIAFWLAGHSQGGMTANRLLTTDYFRDRVDGWLSLSGGRIGPIELPESFFGNRPRPNLPAFPPILGQKPRPGAAVAPDADISFIFTSGEHEMTSLPSTSPWADKYAARPRERLPDIVDHKPGYVYDTTRAGNSTAAWGLRARPGRAEIYVYPGARRVIADIIRLDKGHTEGLEPNVTEAIAAMMASAPGGKAKSL
jgi:hypothetical protein